MRNVILVLSILIAVAAGIFMGRAWWPEPRTVTTASDSDDREVLYWQAPMDPTHRSDKPGKSPMGMDLVPVYADADAAEGIVSIDPVMVSNLGVRTAAAAHGSLSRRIDTVGYVGFDEYTLQHVHTRVEGWIQRLQTRAAGEPVTQGQLLFELYSPTLVNAQQEYLAASRSGTPGLREASRVRLLALGVDEAEIERLDRERTVRQRVSMHARTDGFIAQLGVREGMYVDPSTDIMSIAQLDRVWVEAEVFERQASWVEAGQLAEVELDYLPGIRLRGTVDYVYPELDPDTRTLRVRLRFENEGLLMRPNMFARVTLHGAETGPVVHVPREALIRGGTVDRVVVALGEGKFRVQPVETGIESGDRVALLRGVSAGERVVTSAQFLIDSEANVDSALGRFDADAPEPPPAGHEHGQSPR